jgi:DNA-binding FadR family transcriptional regulator
LHNPLINLFLRSTRAFSCWNITPRQARQPDKSTYLEVTREVMAAIASNDPDAAAAAQYDKFLTMRPFGSQ